MGGVRRIWAMLLAFALPRIEADPIATGVAVVALVGAAVAYLVSRRRH